MTYIADKFNYSYQGNLFQHYAVFFTHFTDLTGADGVFFGWTVLVYSISVSYFAHCCWNYLITKKNNAPKRY